MKTCVTCDDEKDEENFHKNKTECKECLNKRYRDWSATLHGTIKKAAKEHARSDQPNATSKEREEHRKQLYEHYTHLVKKQNNQCYYCGKTVVCDNAGKGRRNSISFDRKDNNQGHTPENTVMCCWECNRTKSNRTDQEFYDYCERIYYHRKATLNHEVDQASLNKYYNVRPQDRMESKL